MDLAGLDILYRGVNQPSLEPDWVPSYTPWASDGTSPSGSPTGSKLHALGFRRDKPVWVLAARQDAAFGLEQVKISGGAARLGAQYGLSGRLALFR